MATDAPSDVDALKEMGNTAFRSADYAKAAGLYARALETLHPPGSNSLQPTSYAAASVLYSNLSAALLKLDKPADALDAAKKCVAYGGDKGYFRKAQALEAQGKLDEALAALEAADLKLPGNAEVVQKMKDMQRLVKARDRQIKEEKRAARRGGDTHAPSERDPSSWAQGLSPKKAAEWLVSLQSFLRALPAPGSVRVVHVSRLCFLGRVCRSSLTAMVALLARAAAAADDEEAEGGHLLTALSPAAFSGWIRHVKRVKLTHAHTHRPTPHHNPRPCCYR